MKWFQEKGITPEGPPPCAHHSDVPAWTAYVAWLLGQEALADDSTFRNICSDAHSQALVSIEVAALWLRRSRIVAHDNTKPGSPAVACPQTPEQPD